MNIENTQLIVLRKTAYQDNHLIVSGISADLGKIDLILYNEQKISVKKFPIIDLFREVQVAFSADSRGDSALFTVKSAELIDNFDAVSNNIKTFETASHMGAFLLKNAQKDLPMPLSYDIFRNVLRNYVQLNQNLNAPWSMIQCSVVFKLICLYENGLLPDKLADNENDSNKIQYMFDSIIENGIEFLPLPDAKVQYYEALNKYLNSLLKNMNL